jgi:TRAP-type mannitol/chloroaromatic compound transport system permease large subunit
VVGTAVGGRTADPAAGAVAVASGAPVAVEVGRAAVMETGAVTCCGCSAQAAKSKTSRSKPVRIARITTSKIGSIIALLDLFGKRAFPILVTVSRWGHPSRGKSDRHGLTAS